MFSGILFNFGYSTPEGHIFGLFHGGNRCFYYIWLWEYLGENVVLVNFEINLSMFETLNGLKRMKDFKNSALGENKSDNVSSTF